MAVGVRDDPAVQGELEPARARRWRRRRVIAGKMSGASLLTQWQPPAATRSVISRASVRLSGPAGRRRRRCGRPPPCRTPTASATSAGQLLEEVAGDDARRVGAGDLDRAGQPLAAVVLLGPDQGLEPGHRVGVGDVERVQVDPAAPRDLRQRGRQRGRAGHLAAQVRRRPEPHCGVRRRPRVAPPVREEVEPGAGAGLDQRDRPDAAPRARTPAAGWPAGRPRWSGSTARGSSRGSCRRPRAGRSGARRTARARARRASGPPRRPGWAASSARAARRPRPAPRGRRPPRSPTRRSTATPRAPRRRSWRYCSATPAYGSTFILLSRVRLRSPARTGATEPRDDILGHRHRRPGAGRGLAGARRPASTVSSTRWPAMSSPARCSAASSRRSASAAALMQGIGDAGARVGPGRRGRRRRRRLAGVVADQAGQGRRQRRHPRPPTTRWAAPAG